MEVVYISQVIMSLKTFMSVLLVLTTIMSIASIYITIKREEDLLQCDDYRCAEAYEQSLKTELNRRNKLILISIILAALIIFIPNGDVIAELID